MLAHSLDLLFPFLEFAFLKKALIACVVLCFGSVSLGVFLLLKRMSLMGDALSHSLLPGVALGYFLFGFSLPAMSIGGFLAGVLILLLSTWVTQNTRLKQESSFASFYLISLSFGVLIISSKGTATDLQHVLFGNLLAVDNSLLILIGITTSFTLLFLAAFYRALVLEAFDPGAFKSYSTQKQGSQVLPWIFLGLLVANLVASFHAIGTLLSLGLVVLPAATSLLWVQNIQKAILLSLAFALWSCYLGLLLSFHLDFASGPSIVLVVGCFYLLSLLAQPFLGKKTS